MAQFNYEDFLAMQNERAARAQGATTTYDPNNRINFLKLADGEKALVRFAFDDLSDFKVYTVHTVDMDGKKWQKVNCLRNFRDPIDTCPLCAAGIKYKQIIYVPMLRYLTDENGQLVNTEPVVFERPSGFLKELNSFYTEYGDLSKTMFTIERQGSGASDTRYTFMPKNVAIFNEQAYPIDFSAFNDFTIMGRFIKDLPYEKLVDLASGNLAPAGNNFVPPTFEQKTPVYTNTVNTVVTPAYNGYGSSAAPRYAAPSTSGEELQVNAVKVEPVRRVTY